MAKKENIEIAKIITNALPGSDRKNCFNEALILAIEKNTDVDLTHNGRVYEVSITRVIASIKQVPKRVE